jgi:Spy/CpxP family protein refolding chaperone
MTSLVWARELAATSMQLQSMYNMVRCYELELNQREERSREAMVALLAKHESELQAQKDEIESLKSQVNLMQMLLQGLQLAEKVDNDDYQP